MYLGDIQYELGVARASINVPSPEAAIRYQTLGAPRFKHAVPPPTVWYVYIRVYTIDIANSIAYRNST